MKPAVCTLALLGAAVLSAAAGADTPRRNPFAMPEAHATPKRIAAPTRGTEPEPEPAFRVHAVLAAGDGSLANIDGRILATGETIDGYRVMSIGEQRVVLQRGARRIVLGVFDTDDAKARD